jgi:hypothetical protein
MKKAIATLCMIFGTSWSPAQSPPARLTYFGYYLVDCGVPDKAGGVIGTKTNFTDEVAWHTNLNQMAVYNPSDNLSARVESMNRQTQKPFVSIENIFWYRIPGQKTAQDTDRFFFHSDYRARWNTFKATNAAVLDPLKLGCLYLIDEPVWHGVPYSELNSVAQLVKNDFPSIPLMYIEAYTTLDSMRIPPSVDWVGFDQYFTFDPANDAAYKAKLATLKAKAQQSNRQKIFIIADTHWIPEYGMPPYYKSAYDNSAMLQSYFNLASSDPDVIGILGYLWVGGFDAPMDLGVRNMPQSVIDLNLDLGRKIKLNGQVPPSPPTGLRATNVTRSGFTLRWSAVSDVAGAPVLGYEVYVNGVWAGASKTPIFAVKNRPSNTNLSVIVNAFDKRGNISGWSQVLPVKTL